MSTRCVCEACLQGMFARCVCEVCLRGVFARHVREVCQRVVFTRCVSEARPQARASWHPRFESRIMFFSKFFFFHSLFDLNMHSNFSQTLGKTIKIYIKILN